jgi:hypothetical protein
MVNTLKRKREIYSYADPNADLGDPESLTLLKADRLRLLPL